MPRLPKAAQALLAAGVCGPQGKSTHQGSSPPAPSQGGLTPALSHLQPPASERCGGSVGRGECIHPPAQSGPPSGGLPHAGGRGKSPTHSFSFSCCTAWG
uniref:Uncharacterized protein n=1 Tax=Crocodylus porosus TaxID=8502 RepID=A0A7M4FLJ6_CROPO